MPDLGVWQPNRVGECGVGVVLVLSFSWLMAMKARRLSCQAVFACLPSAIRARLQLRVGNVVVHVIRVKQRFTTPTWPVSESAHVQCGQQVKRRAQHNSTAATRQVPSTLTPPKKLGWPQKGSPLPRTHLHSPNKFVQRSHEMRV